MGFVGFGRNPGFGRPLATQTAIDPLAKAGNPTRARSRQRARNAQASFPPPHKGPHPITLSRAAAPRLRGQASPSQSGMHLARAFIMQHSSPLLARSGLARVSSASQLRRPTLLAALHSGGSPCRPPSGSPATRSLGTRAVSAENGGAAHA